MGDDQHFQKGRRQAEGPRPRDGERRVKAAPGGAPTAGKERGGHLEEGTPGWKEEGEAETRRESQGGGGDVGQAGRKQGAVFGQRCVSVWEKAGARRQHGRCTGGGAFRRGRQGVVAGEEEGAGGTGSPQDGGGERRPRQQQGRGTAEARALTGVPPQGAAGGLLAQVREEEVPGGLEVLEGAELDNGAGHGSWAPGSGTRLT